MKDKKKLTELVIKAQAGNQDALNDLIGACYEDLYFFAYQTIKDPDTASDIIQDSCISIITNLGKLQSPEAFSVWARNITYNHCAMHFRKTKEVQPLETEDGESILDSLPDESEGSLPEQVIEDKEFRKTMLDMLDSLPGEQRSAMMLYYYEKLSVKQIADVFEISEGTIKSRLNYGRKAMKGKVEEYEKKNGVRLHSSLLPLLLLWLFQNKKQSMPKAAVPIVAGVSATAAASAGAAATVSGGLVIKIVAGVVAAVVAVSAVVGGIKLFDGNTDQDPAHLHGTTPTSNSTQSTEAIVPSRPAKPSEPTVPEGSEPAEPLPTEPTPSEPDMPSVPTECSHSYEAQLHNPTCTAEGYTVYTCTLCADSYQADEKDPLGHVYSAWQITQQESCTQSGKKQHTCSRCDKSETEITPATGHQYKGEITIPAFSCKDQGEKTFTCQGCSASYNTTFKGNHNFVYNSDDVCYYCSSCDEYYFDEYMEFEADHVELDRTSAMCCDTIKLKESSYSGPLSAWPQQWFEYSSFVKEGIVMHGWNVWSGWTEDDREYYTVGQNLSQEEIDTFMADFNAFLNAFSDYYGWTPTPVKLETNQDNGYTKISYSWKTQYNTYRSQSEKLSAEKKDAIVKDQVAYYVHNIGLYSDIELYDDMQLYTAANNIVGYLRGIIAGYDKSLVFHSAYDAVAAGSCVCDGFSELYMYFAEYCGIQADEVIGTINGFGHAWNRVTFSDGTVRYVDPTNYYVLTPDEELRETHNWK